MHFNPKQADADIDHLAQAKTESVEIRIQLTSEENLPQRGHVRVSLNHVNILDVNKRVI